jgi:hypothetical protein
MDLYIDAVAKNVVFLLSCRNNFCNINFKSNVIYIYIYIYIYIVRVTPKEFNMPGGHLVRQNGNTPIRSLI